MDIKKMEKKKMDKKRMDRLYEAFLTEMEIFEFRRRIHCSPTDRYQIIDYLAEGSFGQVFKCVKLKTKETVAVKVIDTKTSGIGSYENECDILRRLSLENADKYHFVRTLEVFSSMGKGFLVCEMLGQSLHAYEKPIPIRGVRLIATQMLTALAKLSEMKIIHTDIKLDNIMLVDPGRQNFRIKLIDFGSAIDMKTGYFPRRVQILCYRAPEVLLRLPYCESIDMWATGCVLARLILQIHHLYPGSSEYDQVKLICEMNGMPHEDMLEKSPVAESYFYKEECSQPIVSVRELRRKWRLKTPEEYERETGMKYHEKRKYFLKTLDDIFDVQRNGHASTLDSIKTEEEECIDLLKRMLEFDPERRITPDEALDHNFIFTSWIDNSYMMLNIP